MAVFGCEGLVGANIFEKDCKELTLWGEELVPLAVLLDYDWLRFTLLCSYWTDFYILLGCINY